MSNEPSSDAPENEPVTSESESTSGETQDTESQGNESANSPSAAGNAPGTGLSEDHVREALKEVIDPELFVNIVDLGLIYTVNVTDREDGKHDVAIEMTMTSPMCPAGPQLVANSRDAIAKIESVESVDVKVVMDPPWTQDMMTDDAKDQLNIF